jgi:hypothetical protein
MNKIIALREIGQTALVAGSRRNKGDNLHNIRRKAIRNIRNKKRAYLKDKSNKLARVTKLQVT